MPNGRYEASSCEHFGISTYCANPSKILYRWLLPDPANPGQLKRNATDISIPSPIWSVIQPINPALPPVIVAEIQAPPPPPVPARFGDARWVKVYTTEIDRKVDLDELVGDNCALVPQDVEQQEVSWDLLQEDPADGGKRRQRVKRVNQGNAGNGKHAVVRRYEYYKYSDAVDALTVTLAGGGAVSSADKVYRCGNKCYGVYRPGSSVTLTAKANSGTVTSTPAGIHCGSTCAAKYAPGSAVTLVATPPPGLAFLGWSGACSGVNASCSLTLNADTKVQASLSR